jgi:hypothetical protein
MSTTPLNRISWVSEPRHEARRRRLRRLTVARPLRRELRRRPRAAAAPVRFA